MRAFIRSMLRFIGLVFLVTACAERGATLEQPQQASVIESRATAQYPQCDDCTSESDCTLLIAGCAFDLSTTSEQCTKDVGALVMERDSRIDCEIGAAEWLRGATLACEQRHCVLRKPASPHGDLPRHVDLISR